MFSRDDYYEYFILEFKSDRDWSNVLDSKSLLLKKKKLCELSGFCEESAFDYERLVGEEDEGWGSDECFVCHALMEDLEVP